MLCVETQYDCLDLVRVDRTTKHRVYCGVWTFDRSGRVYPRQKWNYTRARIATVDDAAKVEEETRRRRCISVILAKCDNINELRKLTTEKLVKLALILETT